MPRRMFVPVAECKVGGITGVLCSTVAILILLLNGCALRPEWQKLAMEQGLEASRLRTGRFEHLVLATEPAGKHLRILVEGDGTPWIRNSRVAVDPTPANPVLLRLMSDAPGSTVYLGRPCYFGTATSQGCESGLWTFDRYGRVVVNSMCAAANELAQRFAAETVQLIGYSGGGTIVVAMAGCTEHVVEITTIAANLDPRAWAEFHNFSPLSDLEPLHDWIASSLPVSELHWQCVSDKQVPPALTESYFSAVKGAARRVVDRCTHARGWDRYWPEIIRTGGG